MISLIHRAIFVHIPKCAGQSIEQAFLKDVAPDGDFERHRHLLTCFGRPWDWSAEIPGRLAHLKAHQYLDFNLVPPSVWDGSFRFAVVRDPLERAISMWRYRSVGLDFDAFATEYLPANIAKDFWFEPQHTYTHSPQTGESLLHEIIPFAELQLRWPAIRERVGMKPEPLPARNKSQKPPPESISDAARESIRTLYAEDYARLGEYFA